MSQIERLISPQIYFKLGDRDKNRKIGERLKQTIQKYKHDPQMEKRCSHFLIIEQMQINATHFSGHLLANIRKCDDTFCG